ncbi:MAG: hypothetical protein ACI30H_05185 [Paludibacteraceae bacterium]
MKKFFSVWFVALLCGFTTAVSASVTVTLNCEPSDVSISGLTPDNGSWAKGENTCTVSYGSAYMNVSTSLTDKVLDAAITSSGSTTHRNSTSGLYSVYVQDGASVVISLYDVETLRTATFTLNVADASKVQLFRSDNTEVTLANGNNTVKFADGSHESEYAETSFTVRTSESDVLLTYSSSNLEPTSNYSTLGSLTFPAKDGATVSVSLYNLDDIRTASVTVNVDDPSKLSVVRGGRSIYFTEQNNNTIKFVSSHSSGYTESNFTFSGNGNWYTLKNGDNTLSSFSSNYNWTATNGATVDVVFAVPDVNVSVKFEGTIDAFSKVEVDGVEVDKARWSADDYTVKLGAQITLYGDHMNYTLNSFSLNGTVSSDILSSLNSGSSYTFRVASESAYTVNLSATKLEPFDIYLTVNHPEVFSVSSSSDGSSPYEQVVVNEAEPNRLKVTLPGKTSYVYFNALDGCSFDSIKDGAGNPISCYSSPVTINKPAADAEFSVWINKPERPDTLYVYFDYPEYLSGGYVSRNYKNVIAFQYSYESGAAAHNEQYKGWNKIAFDPATESSFYISLYGYYAYIYHNGVQKPGYYGPETSSYGFTATNNDSIVVNILLSASFNIAGSATVNMVSPADVDPTKTFYVAPETEVQFTTNGSSVQVNYTDDIVADGDGVYTVTVSSNNTSIAIGAPTTTAIEAVTIEKPRNNNVYTLQGILLIQNASEAQINALPCGLYIINGEKRIVTNRR